MTVVGRGTFSWTLAGAGETPILLSMASVNGGGSSPHSAASCSATMRACNASMVSVVVGLRSCLGFSEVPSGWTMPCWGRRYAVPGLCNAEDTSESNNFVSGAPAPNERCFSAAVAYAPPALMTLDCSLFNCPKLWAAFLDVAGR